MERHLVENAGTKYLHLPVSTRDMKSEAEDQFGRELQSLLALVFVYCPSGRRAGVVGVTAASVNADWSGEQTLETAEKIGCGDYPKQT